MHQCLESGYLSEETRSSTIFSVAALKEVWQLYKLNSIFILFSNRKFLIQETCQCLRYAIWYVPVLFVRAFGNEMNRVL